MKKLFLILVIAMLISTPLLSGCAIGILAAGVGYAVGQGRQGTAKQMEAKGKFLERYNTYKIGMENINLEREKAGLKPQPIDEFEAWLNKQPLTPEEMKLFQHNKAQTPAEVKDQKNTTQVETKPVESKQDNKTTSNNFSK